MTEPNFKSDIARECFKDLYDSAEREMNRAEHLVERDNMFESMLKLAIHRQTMIENAWSTAADIEAKFLINNAACFGLIHGKD